MTDDATYPHTPGAQDTDTSQEAAEAIAPVAGRLRTRVFSAISKAGAFGMTTNECANALNIDKGSIQPRTSELQVLGRIKDSGDRRLNASGKRAIVWVAI